MRFSLLKPVNGWSGFLTELAIVVLGVLIALGAQQAVDAWRWRGEVREFRSAVDNEIGYNLGAYIDRLKQSDCINRRLDQLDRWHKGVAASQRLPLTSRIGRPTTTTLRTSVWQSRTPEITAHLGLEDRMGYAAIYDDFAGYQVIGDRERVLWGELLDFEGSDSLDSADLKRMRGLVERGRLASRLINGNWPVLSRHSEAFRIRPWEEKDLPASETVCEPLTWTAN